MKTAQHPRFNTSDAAIVKRGWRIADVWMASLMALVGMVGAVLPGALALPRAKRLNALRHIRRLEALVRRLVMAMAADAKWPQTGPHTKCAGEQNLPAVTQLNQLGLANHWRPPQPSTHSSLAQQAASGTARQPGPATIRLLETVPDTCLIFTDRPVSTAQSQRGPGPRILDLSMPYPKSVPGCVTMRDPGGAGLIRRIAALRAVLADPERMVRRMARWMAARGDKLRREYRHYPVNIVLPRSGLPPDMRDELVAAQTVARARMRRRDSG